MRMNIGLIMIDKLFDILDTHPTKVLVVYSVALLLIGALLGHYGV
jgi:hypothetical protein